MRDEIKHKGYSDGYSDDELCITEEGKPAASWKRHNAKNAK